MFLQSLGGLVLISVDRPDNPFESFFQVSVITHEERPMRKSRSRKESPLIKILANLEKDKVPFPENEQKNENSLTCRDLCTELKRVQGQTKPNLKP